MLQGLKTALASALAAAVLLVPGAVAQGGAQTPAPPSISSEEVEGVLIWSVFHEVGHAILGLLKLKDPSINVKTNSVDAEIFADVIAAHLMMDESKDSVLSVATNILSNNEADEPLETEPHALSDERAALLLCIYVQKYPETAAAQRFLAELTAEEPEVAQQCRSGKGEIGADLLQANRVVATLLNRLSENAGNAPEALRPEFYHSVQFPAAQAWLQKLGVLDYLAGSMEEYVPGFASTLRMSGINVPHARVVAQDCNGDTRTLFKRSELAVVVCYDMVDLLLDRSPEARAEAQNLLNESGPREEEATGTPVNVKAADVEGNLPPRIRPTKCSRAPCAR